MKFNIYLIAVIISPIKAQSQLLTQFCSLGNKQEGIYIQQVDEDWNKVSFDCENIEVLVVAENFKNHILPGQFYNCNRRIPVASATD